MIPTLAEWLQANDLVEFAGLLEQNEVDIKTLEVLTDADLKELGLSFGPRKRILNAIAEYKKSATPRRSGRESAGSGAPGERRQLTVMFCDLVGSTALAGRLDPEELRALIQSYRKACGDVAARYEGHVAQYLGDGLMIYFGWPVAHEDDAERGVRAALEMVEAVKAIAATPPLAIRVGLATGPVVVGETSPDANSEGGLAVGETPNLAARLQALAGSGEVVIAPATRRLLGDIFSLTDLGNHILKGVAQPVTLWRVDEAHRGAGRFQAAHAGSQIAPLIGRDEESSLLASRWRYIKEGEGQVVLIGGQAGIGKSRLTQELRGSRRERHTMLHYQCSPYHRNSPLHPFIEQLELAAGFLREDTPEQRLDKLERALGGDAAYIQSVAPLFAALHSLPVARYPARPLSPQKQKEQTLEAMIARVEAMARRAPVLMVVEDIHWVDPTSQELLELLVPRVRAWPVLLVLTYRLEYIPAWVSEPGVTTITLNRLDRRQGARLVDTVTKGRGLPPEVLDEILARTDGVPLFVEELTRSVLESGQLREEGGQYILQGSMAALAIPASLRDSLMARLDRLGPGKEFAQVGACIGREFSFDLLERVTQPGAPALETALEGLLEAGLVTRRDVPPAAVYTFKHALVQDAAYDSLLKTRRSELHARIAQVLARDFSERVATAPEWLAHHLTQAGQLAQAIPLWRKAGILAVARVALKEAVAHFQKGLGLVEQLPASRERDAEELTIREPLNAAFTGLRGWAAPEVSVNAAATLRLAESQGNAQSQLLATWWVWSSTITQGRIAESLPWVQRLVAAAATADDPDLRTFGHALAMVQHFLSGELAESRHHANRALALYDPARGERWIGLTGHNLRTFVEVYTCQLIWIQGFPDEARRFSDEIVAHAHADGHAFNLLWAMTFSAYVFAYSREPGRLMERVAAVERLAREQGMTFIYEVSVPQAQGIAEFQQGRMREASSLLRLGIERWTKTGGHVRVPLVKSVLAQAVAQEGDAARALELIDECVAQIERPSGQERLWLAEVLRCKGLILLRLGREAEAETQLRAAIACARQQEARSWELRGATALAALLARRGEHATARELLEPVYSWFTEGSDTPDLVEARALLDGLGAPAGG